MSSCTLMQFHWNRTISIYIYIYHVPVEAGIGRCLVRKHDILWTQRCVPQCSTRCSIGVWGRMISFNSALVLKKSLRVVRRMNISTHLFTRCWFLDCFSIAGNSLLFLDCDRWISWTPGACKSEISREIGVQAFPKVFTETACQSAPWCCSFAPFSAAFEMAGCY